MAMYHPNENMRKGSSKKRDQRGKEQSLTRMLDIALFNFLIHESEYVILKHLKDSHYPQYKI